MEQAKIVSAKEASSGQPLTLYRLALDMHGCATESEMNSNFFATLKRGYTPIMDYLGKFSGTVSLVGAGPSIKETYKELKVDVIAINSAIGWLLDKGVVPKFAMLWDAADIVENFAIPHPGIIYLVGSRCHPKVFDRLKDCKVIVWHAGGDHNINQMIIDHGINEPLVNGGSAGITRGMFLVRALGYDDLHIFGADSSYEGDSTHVNGSLVPEKDIMVSIGCDPPMFFRTTPEWCAQVEEFRAIYAIYSFEKVSVKVYGKGMLPEMYKRLSQEKEKLGLEKLLKKCHQQEIERQELNLKASQSTQPLEVSNAGI